MLEGEYTRFKRRFVDGDLDYTLVLDLQEYEVGCALEALAAEDSIKKMVDDYRSKIVPLLETRYTRKKNANKYKVDGRIDFFREKMGLESVPEEIDDDIKEYLNKIDLFNYYSMYLHLRKVSFSQEVLRKIIDENLTTKQNIQKIRALFQVSNESKIFFDNMPLWGQKAVAEIIVNENIWDLDYILFGYRLKEEV